MSGLLGGAEYSAGREAGVQEDFLHEDHSATNLASDASGNYRALTSRNPFHGAAQTMSMRWQACLTDLDGTLLFSQGVQTRAWSAWGAARGVDVQRLLAAHGMTHVEKISRYAPHLDAPGEAALVEALELTDTSGVRALPGAAQLLGSGWLVAIVTSATRQLANVRLAAAGLEPPGVMVCAEDVTYGKPHPEPYRRAADLLGVPPCRCVAFEDAPAGVASAVAAGAYVVAVTSTVSSARLADAHEVVPDLAAYLAFMSEPAVLWSPG
jgi:mannitol-1-/sugar-/sorbitol-6-phosphatase